MYSEAGPVLFCKLLDNFNKILSKIQHTMDADAMEGQDSWLHACMHEWMGTRRVDTTTFIEYSGRMDLQHTHMMGGMHGTFVRRRVHFTLYIYIYI